jgi:peroxiredoxin
VLGVSMDSFASNKEFATKIGVNFPLLSDWKRTVTKEYGLYNEANGYGNRGTFVIDKDGIIQHIETGRTAVDPTGAYQACDLIQKRKVEKKSP